MWGDLPWAEHPVTLRYPLRRLWCRHCGIRTEGVGFGDPHARLTRRFRQRIGLDCQSMPTSHAAVRHAVSWGTARRAERAFLEAWDRTRPIEGGEDARLALKSSEPLRIACELIGQYLDRYVAIELRIMRSIDVAHAAAPEQSDARTCSHRSKGRRWTRCNCGI